MEDVYCKFERFTGFITNENKRVAAIEVTLKGDKDEVDGKKKWGKRDRKKKVVHGSVI